MITKQTQAKINDLICALSDRATKAINAGSEMPLSAVETLTRLIEATAGGETEDKAPVCGFVVPSPVEADEE